jgi:hypothetical protein
MKVSTIALAGAVALTSTFAVAQSSGGAASGVSTSGAPAAADRNSAMTPNGAAMIGTGPGTTGTARSGTGGPNGSAKGSTSLSGTGSSKAGGDTPGATSK